MYRISIESSASHQRHRPSGHGTRSISPTPRFISQTTIWIYCFGRNYYRAFVRVISWPRAFFRYRTVQKILRALERSLAYLPRAYLDRVCLRSIRVSFFELFFAARQNPLTWKAIGLSTIVNHSQGCTYSSANFFLPKLTFPRLTDQRWASYPPWGEGCGRGIQSGEGEEGVPHIEYASLGRGGRHGGIGG